MSRGHTIAMVSSMLNDSSAFLVEVNVAKDFLASSIRPRRMSHLVLLDGLSLN